MKVRFLLLPVLLAASVAGCGGGGGNASLNANDIATVGPLHITKQRFQDQLNVAKVNLAAQGQKFPKAGTTEFETLKANAIAGLVQSAARELAADKMGIDVTDKDVEKRLTEIKKQYFGGSEKTYLAQVKKQGLTDAEVHAQIRTQLISEKVAEQLTGDVSVSDDEVHAYYVANASQYRQTTRDVLEILVGKNKKALAQKLYEQLKGGADFGKLAKKYSQDPGSKDKGGKFTAVQGRDVAEFDRVAFSAKTGEIAPPVETPEYGWFIIKPVGDVKKTITPEKEAASSIRAQLSQEKQNQELTDWLANANKSVCTGGRITYQVGYTPNPDPCLQYTSTSTTTTP